MPFVRRLLQGSVLQHVGPGFLWMKRFDGRALQTESAVSMGLFSQFPFALDYSRRFYQVSIIQTRYYENIRLAKPFPPAVACLVVFILVSSKRLIPWSKPSRERHTS